MNRIKDIQDRQDFRAFLSNMKWWQPERVKWYRLLGKTPVPCADLLEWAEYYEKSGTSRIVRQDRVNTEILVSTVFLSLDHNYRPDGPPILFETMVFNGPKADTMRHYATWDEAEKGHAEVLAEVLSMQ